MPRKLLPSMFNKRIEFGTVKSVEDDNTGDYKETFVSQFSLWAYPNKRTLNQQYQLLGTNLTDTIVLIIRHNSNVNDSLKLKYNGQQYDILDVSSDDSLNYMSYDYLTVKLTSKVG